MTQPDTYFMKIERSSMTLSLAVRLVDDYTASSDPVGNVSVYLTEIGKAAVRNPSGYYVFTNLPAATYELNVESDYYLRQTVSVSTAGSQNTVKKIILIPTGAYPFMSGATLIRGVVVGQGGEVLAGATVQVTTLVPDSSIKAKVGPAGITAGDTGMVMVNISGQLAVGDGLMVKDAKESRVEFCTITAPLPVNPGVDPYRLATPLKFNHAAGTALYYLGVDSILDTGTNGNGEFVIYFSRVKTSRFISRVAIGQVDYQEVEREVDVCEGALVSLGRIQLVP